MAVRIELAAVMLALAAAAPAHADPSDADIIGTDPGWHLDDVELRSSFIDQRGHGYQAQGAPIGQPGSEAMTILENWALIDVHQSARVEHQVMVPVDVITAASPDAVDATTSASRINPTQDVDWRTTIRRSATDTLMTRVALHHEEPLSSGTLGAGYERSLADDNATIAVSGAITVDGFDHHDHYGDYLGKTARETFNANVLFSQLLSPTTVIDGGYGVTYEHGTMDIGWNAVPTAAGSLTDEILPRDRLRHAFSLRLAQHVPPTHTTIKTWYRFYADDWGLRAHSIEVDLYQYIVSWLYVRGGYRYHHQNGVDFFTTDLPVPFTKDQPRTADSDLAPLSSQEWSVQLATVHGKGPLGKWSLSAEVLRYVRTNDLALLAVSLGIGRLL